MKKSNFTTSVILPLLAAFIWGTAFTSQSMCVGKVSPFYLNGIRSVIAAIVLAMVALMVSTKKKESVGSRKDVITGSVVCGFFLFAAANLQQLGIDNGTDGGKAGFITAVYAVIVPIIELLRHKKVSLKTWVSIVIALTGLYLLCISSDFSIEINDVYVAGAAVFFALQIIALNYFTQKVNAIALSSGQFLVVAILSFSVAIPAESIDPVNIITCLPELLYLALFSSCIAYTFQVISLRDGNPTIVSLLYCLESVFAVVSGAIILGETMTGREVIGCVVMLAGIVISQLPEKSA